MFLRSAVRVLLAVSMSAAGIVGLSSAHQAFAIEDVSCATVPDRSTVFYAANALGGLCLRGSGVRTMMFPYEIYVYCAGPYSGEIFFDRPAPDGGIGQNLAPVAFSPGVCRQPPAGLQIAGVRIT